MSFTLICVVLILLLNSKSLDCVKRRIVCDKMKLDNCTTNILMMGNPALKYPELLEETNIYCSALRDNAKCMKDYTKKCLDKFPRQAIRLLTYSIGNYVRGICDDTQSYYQVMFLLRCINRAKTAVDKCYANLVETFTQTSKLSQSKYKIPLTCCNYWIFSDCVSEAIREESTQDRVCTKSHVNEFGNYFDGVTQKLVNNFCGHYKHGSVLCANLISLNLLNSTSIHRFSKSVLPPLIDIVLSF